MARRRRVFGLTLSVLVGVALVVTLVAVSYAQGGPGGQEGGRERGARVAQQMWRPAMATPAIAVAGDKVFVAAGGKLYRFDANTLELEAEATYAQLPPIPRGGPGEVPPAPAQ